MQNLALQCTAECMYKCDLSHVIRETGVENGFSKEVVLQQRQDRLLARFFFCHIWTGQFHVRIITDHLSYFLAKKTFLLNFHTKKNDTFN